MKDCYIGTSGTKQVKNRETSHKRTHDECIFKIIDTVDDTESLAIVKTVVIAYMKHLKDSGKVGLVCNGSEGGEERLLCWDKDNKKWNGVTGRKFQQGSVTSSYECGDCIYVAET